MQFSQDKYKLRSREKFTLSRRGFAQVVKLNPSDAAARTIASLVIHAPIFLSHNQVH